MNPTLALTQKLIACPSITPVDAGCQSILIEHLNKIGFHIEKFKFQEVDNFWAVHGQGAPYFVFAGHTDVVPIGDRALWSQDPFKPWIENGYLYGRGAADMKGSLAAMVTAVERYIKAKPNHQGSIGFLITGDEEGPAKNGTRKVIEYLKSQGLSFDYCIVGEPSSLKSVGDTLKIGRRGSLSGALTIQGIQGHIAYPENAKNPIHNAFSPLLELIQTEWDQGTADFPKTSFQISNIHAGAGVGNVIPGSLDCLFNFRFNPSHTFESLKKQVCALLDKYQEPYQLHWEFYGNAFLTQKGKLLKKAVEILEEQFQLTPRLSTDGGTSDARFIIDICPEIIELGPCNATIHSVNECVKVDDLILLSEMYEKILEALLK